MKKYICLLFFLGVCNGIYAQTVEELDAEILKYIECVKNFSKPEVHKNKYSLSSGKMVEVLEQSDFDRSVFSSIDAFMENLDKILDSSPFLYGKQRILMDGKDLSKWEYDEISTISNEYFSSGKNTFHLASHGLVDPSDQSSWGVRIGGQDLNAEETAELILESMAGVNHIILNAKQEPFTIVLHCCESGKGNDSFAAKLSAELAKEMDNVAVIAAPDLVYATLDEQGKYTERVASKTAISLNRVEKDAQNWLVFKNGKKVMTGLMDYGKTISKYMNSEVSKK